MIFIFLFLFQYSSTKVLQNQSFESIMDTALASKNQLNFSSSWSSTCVKLNHNVFNLSLSIDLRRAPPLVRGVPRGQGGQAPVPHRHPDRQGRPRRETQGQGERAFEVERLLFCLRTP